MNSISIIVATNSAATAATNSAATAAAATSSAAADKNYEMGYKFCNLNTLNSPK